MFHKICCASTSYLHDKSVIPSSMKWTRIRSWEVAYFLTFSTFSASIQLFVLIYKHAGSHTHTLSLSLFLSLSVCPSRALIISHLLRSHTCMVSCVASPWPLAVSRSLCAMWSPSSVSARHMPAYIYAIWSSKRTSMWLVHACHC